MLVISHKQHKSEVRAEQIFRMEIEERIKTLEDLKKKLLITTNESKISSKSEPEKEASK